MDTSVRSRQLTRLSALSAVAVLISAGALCAEDFFAQDRSVRWRQVMGTQKDLDDTAKELIRQGYRLSNIEMASTGTNLHFIGVFIVNDDNIDFQAGFNNDWNGFQRWHQQYVASGMIPVDFEVAKVGQEIHYSGIWMKDPKQRRAVPLFNQTERQLDESSRDLLQKKYSPIDIEVVATAQGPRFTTIWIEGQERGAPTLVWNRPAEFFEKEMTLWRGDGVRPVDFETYTIGNTTYFAAIYVLDNQANWTAEWGLKWDQWHSKNQPQLEEGRRPIDFMQCQRPECLCVGAIWFAPAPEEPERTLVLKTPRRKETEPRPRVEPAIERVEPTPLAPLTPVPVRDEAKEQELKRQKERDRLAQLAAEAEKAARQRLERRALRLEQLVATGKLTSQQRGTALLLFQTDPEALSAAEAFLLSQFERLADDM